MAYATAPGTVAEDGDGANSPFTVALADSMKQQGLTLEAVLKRTRLKVQEATNGSQLPFDSSAITGDFYFVPVVATETPPQTLLQPQTPLADPAQAAYLAAGDDADLLRVVATTFPNSIWGALAAERLKKTAVPEVAPPVTAQEEPKVEEPAAAAVEDTPPVVKAPVTTRKAVSKKPVAKVVAKPRVVKPSRQSLWSWCARPSQNPAPKPVIAVKLPRLRTQAICHAGAFAHVGPQSAGYRP